MKQFKNLKISIYFYTNLTHLLKSKLTSTKISIICQSSN